MLNACVDLALDFWADLPVRFTRPVALSPVHVGEFTRRRYSQRGRCGCTLYRGYLHSSSCSLTAQCGGCDMVSVPQHRDVTVCAAGTTASGTPCTACVSCWMICLRCTTVTASESPPTRFSTVQSPAICHAGPQGIVLGGQGCACHVCHHRGGNSAQRAQICSIGAAAQRTSRSHFFRSELHQGNKRAFASFLLPVLKSTGSGQRWGPRGLLCLQAFC